MDFLGTVILVIIGMVIAGNLHPEGVGLFLLLLMACPFLVGGLKLVIDDGGPLGVLFGLLLMLSGLALMGFFLKIL